MAPPRRPILLVPKPDPDAQPPVPLCAAPRRVEPNIKPDPDAAAPVEAEATMPLTAEICAMLRRELEPSPDDHSDFAHRLRQTQQRLDDISARLSSSAPPPQQPPPVSPPPPLPPPVPPPPPPPASLPPSPSPRDDTKRASSASTRGSKQKRPRGTPGAEMVRATVTAEADLLLVRTAARRARLTFEALRGLYHRRARARASSRAGRNRADMRALTAMLSRADMCLFRDKRIVGPVPGVFVGDAFSYRAELIVVGLHNHTQGGIGYVPAGLVSEGHPVATSIVSSGGYLDDRDNGDLLVYTGSGGRPRNGGAHHADQEFERGNLALAYSCKYAVEVRVIRCHDCDGSPSGKVYVYDGLYKVHSSTYEPGESGREVCKFNLVRLPGQAERGSSVWLAARELTRKLDANNVRPPGYLTLDMAKGKEAVRVPVCNSVDQDRSPLDAEYIAAPARPQQVPHKFARRRRCCTYSATACGGLSCEGCACVKRNGAGVGPAYDADGTLVRGMPVVYECGARCGCPATCPNRVTQRGITHRLEVFRSKDTNWGVRSLDLIRPGAFVCEFTGDLVAVDDDDRRSATGNNADAWGGMVDPRKFPARWREWGDASAAANDDEGPTTQFPEECECPTPGYVLDVSRRRNFAPYICHSAAPNAFVQFVVRGDEDVSCPHLMVFAMETIPPMRELSIDYGIAS